MRDVDVITGDTDQFYWGAVTFASRGAVVAGNTINDAAKLVRGKVLRSAAAHFECAETANHLPSSVPKSSSKRG